MGPAHDRSCCNNSSICVFIRIWSSCGKDGALKTMPLQKLYVEPWALSLPGWRISQDFFSRTSNPNHRMRRCSTASRKVSSACSLRTERCILSAQLRSLGTARCVLSAELCVLSAELSILSAELSILSAIASILNPRLPTSQKNT